MSTSRASISKTIAFDRYAPLYVAFNRAKDYAAEARYVLQQVQRWRPTTEHWLDVGCGTGEHLSFLESQGIRVAGVDASEAMIAQARVVHPQIPFHLATAQAFQFSQDYDVISMLFHVMSYQVADSDVAQALGNTAAHLASGGVLVFDFWHSEGVLHDPPSERVRETMVEGRRMFRIAHPTMDRTRHRIDIHFEFRWDDSNGQTVFEETHSMRYFSRDELANFLRDAGLRVVACEGWMSESALNGHDWYGLICASNSKETTDV